MYVSDHRNKCPIINWNRGEPMTDEEFVALAAKCLLWHHPFQEHTFFTEDCWSEVGTYGMDPQATNKWIHSTLQSFQQANPTTDINRRKQGFLNWLKGKDYIHQENFDTNSPRWEVSTQHVDELVEAIEKPELLASKIFGSCDVFISHAVGDSKASELYEVLKNDYKLFPYMTPDKDPTEQGDEWPPEVLKHLRGAKVVVIVLTEKSKMSLAVNQEIGFTLWRGRDYIVWFDTNSPGWILLPSDRQEYPMSSYDVQQVAKRVHDIVQQLR